MASSSAARKVVVTGATGLLGRRLCAVLRAKSYAVTAVSRDPAKASASGLGADHFAAVRAAQGRLSAVSVFL